MAAEQGRGSKGIPFNDVRLDGHDRPAKLVKDCPGPLLTGRFCRSQRVETELMGPLPSHEGLVAIHRLRVAPVAAGKRIISLPSLSFSLHHIAHRSPRTAYCAPRTDEHRRRQTSHPA